MRFPCGRVSAKAVILAFGGFDSFIEEFYAMWEHFSGASYEVLAFEGPGQGAALRKNGLVFDHDWEKPTAAVLDHFEVHDAALLGVSMGGYWALRAAAFEGRVSRVIAFPPVYDWLAMAGPLTRLLVHRLMRYRRLMNELVRMKMLSKTLKHAIGQTLYITDKRQPIEAVDWMLQMNKSHLRSELVKQDVLLLAGENDAFQPPELLYQQRKALTAARSVTMRIFTHDEQADQHCQIGNVGLALETMIDWLDTKGQVEPARRGNFQGSS